MFDVVALAVVLVASGGYFSWAVFRRFGADFGKRAPLDWSRVPRNAGRLLTEVVFQTRVIGGRPVAGFLHALVMWGFFVFAYVSLEHVVQGFVGLENAERDSSWYGWFAAIWAGGVLVGIAGLVWRRFVIRPTALGSKLSVGSAGVAVLIVGLMVTYLLGWRWLEPASTVWRVNWWLHTLCFTGMLWLIPNSKHLHLVLGPLNVLFRGDVISATRALDEEDDDDLGLVSFEQLTQKDLLDVHACVECGRCTDVCPANQIGGSLSPKAVVLQMQKGVLAGGTQIAGTAADVAEGGAWVAEEDLFQCLSCGACEEACPVGIEHVGGKILDLRRGLVSEGRTEHDKLGDLFNTMERAPHNAWGASASVRKKFVEEEAFPIFDGSQEWLLWMGCGVNYDPHGQDVARAMRKLLDAAGVSWGVLKKETCCGEPARRAGNEYLYMELSAKVVEALEAAGPTKIVTCDPHCCRMLDVDYRQDEIFAELGVEVVHHTQLLARLADRLPAAGSKETVTFHDPCYLARGRDETDAPRRLLAKAGASVREMGRSGRETACCGAGGAQLFLADDKAEGERVNHRRFAQVAATGVEKVAVACPYCHIMLKDGANHARRNDMQVVDVAELLASRLDG